MSWGEIWSWMKAHPLLAALLVFVGGIILLWLFGFFGRSSGASTGGSDAQAYYAAAAVESQAANQLSAMRLQTEAATNIAQIQADTAGRYIDAIKTIQTGQQGVVQAFVAANQAVDMSKIENATRLTQNLQTDLNVYAYTLPLDAAKAASAALVAGTNAPNLLTFIPTH